MSDTSPSSAAQYFPDHLDGKRIALCSLVAGLCLYAFYFQPAENQATTFGWLVGHWSSVSNYSHGPLIPIIASFLLYWNVSKRAPANTDWRPYWQGMAASAVTLGIWMVGGTLKKEWDEPSYYLALKLLPISLVWQVWTLREFLRSDEPPRFGLGVTVIVVALLFYYVGIKAVQPRLVVVAGVLLLLGLSLAFRGGEVWRVVTFPIIFLLLMVPLNFIDNTVGGPLRMFVAKHATETLNLIGIEAYQRGTGIVSKVFRFDVADPCSGIRSLMALSTVTAAYAYVTQGSQWKRWFLFLCAMPLAVLGNMTRVISIAVVAQVYGRDAATRMHDWSGFILFPVALAAMVLIGKLLNFDYREFVQHWMSPPPTPVQNE